MEKMSRVLVFAKFSKNKNKITYNNIWPRNEQGYKLPHFCLNFNCMNIGTVKMWKIAKNYFFDILLKNPSVILFQNLKQLKTSRIFWFQWYLLYSPTSKIEGELSFGIYSFKISFSLIISFPVRKVDVFSETKSDYFLQFL